MATLYHDILCWLDSFSGTHALSVFLARNFLIKIKGPRLYWVSNISALKGKHRDLILSILICPKKSRLYRLSQLTAISGSRSESACGALPAHCKTSYTTAVVSWLVASSSAPLKDSSEPASSTTSACGTIAMSWVYASFGFWVRRLLLGKEGFIF